MSRYRLVSGWTRWAVAALALALAPVSGAGGCAVEGADGLGVAQEEVATRGSVSNWIQVAQSNLCLTAPASGLGAVTQGTCLSNTRNWFSMVPSGNDPNFYNVKAMGNCLDVPLTSTQSGTDLQLYPCHDQTNQQFRLTPSGAGRWQIQPKAGIPLNLCLDIEGGQPTPGARLQQYTCKTIDTGNQRFLGRPVELIAYHESCDADTPLSLGWMEGSFHNWDTLFLGEMAFFNVSGAHFGWDCTDDSDDWIEWTQPGSGFVLGDWDEVFECPPRTTTAEVSRVNRPDADEFRVRCLR